ncbi:MAG: DNA-directed RNA polymerase subunit beta [Bacilli bacterium]|nr:DNA-directed RNA polymerase subunit beta [Bacilli bacterium]
MAYCDDKNKTHIINKINGRQTFSKIDSCIEMPYLLEHQRSSYNYFLNEGIEKAFRENFPVYCDENGLILDFVSLSFEEPKNFFLDCKEKSITYEKQLKVRFRLSLKDKDQHIEQDILICNIPLLTDSATFIISGNERTIISQIVRSPGFYLINNGIDDKGDRLFRADLIPSRGSYLQFENIKNKVYARINRLKKVPLNIFFHALGIKNDDIIEIFGNSKLLNNFLNDGYKDISFDDALINFFSILHVGEIQIKKNAMTFLKNVFFNNAKYDLGDVGRYKLSQRLSIYNLLNKQTLAEDLVEGKNKVFFKKGYTLKQSDIDFLKEKKFFENGAYQKKVQNVISDEYNKVNIVKVFDEQNEIVNVVGTDIELTQNFLTISDIISAFSCFLNIFKNVGEFDDIDSLNNRRIRCVGELLENQVRIGIASMNKAIFQKMRFCKFKNIKDISIKEIVNAKPILTNIHNFFSTSQLSSFLDQTNPLSEITNKRRLSALGPGGIVKDRAVSEVRDVHYTHYGRICPIETPEGQAIGLVNSLASYAKINKYGFLETPYRAIIHKSNKHIIGEKIVYLDVFEEKKYVICEANVNINEQNEILDDFVVARFNYENILAKIGDVDFIDVSPKQIVSLASSCIPFLESDDTTRALMGANMQRQAVPLLLTEEPFVGTGMENIIAHDSGLAVVASEDGVVSYIDSTKIKIKNGSHEKEYFLRKFERSNKGTCIDQKSIVALGDQIKKGQIIADGPAMKNGDLALGKNVVVAFMTWFGYNYEDAIIISDRLVKDDTFTSIYIEEYKIECRETKLGNEEITREVPGVSEEKKAFLDEDGIVMVGTKVKEGDILVGKATPIAVNMPTAIEKFFMTIFSEKSANKKDSSLRVKHGGSGIVTKIQILSKKNKDVLPLGVIKVIKVYVTQKRKINEGDKMSGRHGNKGIISRILPAEDMPFLPDGTPVDIMLNPLGVPSRMNIGQVFELHLGLACKILNLKIATPVFDGISDDEIFNLISKAHLNKDCKTFLYDGITGEQFEEKISVGVMYMIKLDHMVEDKCHARSIGPYTLVAQQPLGGKAQNGGQRFGEMEAWALESYGASYTLQEMFSVKSDDRNGRNKLYEAIVKQQPLPKPNISEAFRVFIKELQALCLNVEVFNKNQVIVSLDSINNKIDVNEKEGSGFVDLFKKNN